jgi:hypothetical protein
MGTQMTGRVGDSINVIESEVVTVNERRTSWGAILAGVVLALVVQIALNMLGLSIGASTINPISEADPIEPALGTAALMWIGGTILLSLFAGGWVAGYFSGTVRTVNGMLHGLVVWAVVSLITFVVATSSLGGIISGLTGAIGQGASLLTQGALAAVPAVADSEALQQLTLSAIGEESRGLFTIEGEDTQAQQDSGTAQFVTLEDLQFNTSVFSYLREQDNEEARQNVITLIAERAQISEQEATAQLDRWTAAYNTVIEDAEETAREVGQTLTDTLTAVAGAVFVAMLLGTFAAGAGGWVGTPEMPRVRSEETR